MLNYWTAPPIDPLIKVYVFNYTNIFEVENGIDELIRVEEVGPYVYRERIVKTHLVFDDDKITFRVSLMSTKSLLLEVRTLLSLNLDTIYFDMTTFAIKMNFHLI